MNRKNIVWGIFMTMAGSAFFSCEKDTLPRLCEASSSGGDRVTLEAGKPITIFNNCSGPVKLGISIYDSRCPSDGICVWQGILLADLKLNDNFSIQLQQNKAVDTVFLNEHYTIKLIDAIPFPSSASLGKPQTAILSITKQ